MSYKANIVRKFFKRLSLAISHWSLAMTAKKQSNVGNYVGKWLAGEGRNFITMATL